MGRSQDTIDGETWRGTSSMETRSKPTTELHLLRLPSEIRNLIYEILFTDISPSSELVFYSEDDAKPPGQRLPTERRRIHSGFTSSRSRDGHHMYALKEYNQLKYVCRQLEAECKDLELRYSPLLFRRVKDDLPGKRFVDLISGPAGKNASWLRRVELDPVNVSFERHEYQFDDVKTFVEIVNFCRDNPRTQIQYNIMNYSRIKNKRRQIWLFARTFVFLRNALRGHLDIFKRHGPYRQEYGWHFKNERLRAREWREGHKLAELNAPNLSLRCKSTSWTSEHLLLQSEVHYLVPYVRDFIKDGL